MRKRQKTREERELAASLAEVSEKELAKKSKRSRKSKKSQPATPELVERPLFMSPSLPAPPIPPLPTTLRPAPALVPTLAKKRLDDFDVNSIQNFQELLAALRAKKVQITLGNNIIATDNILINYDVAINFNGHSIISDESIPAARVLDIRSGEVTLTGKGKIFAMGDRSVALRVFGAISTEMPSYTTVTIDEGISLFSPSSHAIFVAANLGAAYGLKLNFSGEIIAHDGICLSADVRGDRPRNLPVITLKSGARIVVDENSGAALSALGYGIWEVGAVCLRGASGLRAKSGQIKCLHTQMVSNGPADIATFQIESNDNAANLELTIDGGTYVSENSYIIAGDASSFQKISVKDSDFHGARGDYPDNIRTALAVSTQVSHNADFAAEMRPISLPTLPAAPAPEELPDMPAPVTASPQLPTPQPAAQPSPASTMPIPENAPKPVSETEPELDEREAARNALAEAISEIEKLQSTDYVSGFSALRRAISQAKKVLRHSRASLMDIRDAAGDLLSAFDNLEERDEMSLSDEELDELFYHGAILEEMASERKKPAKTHKKSRLFAKKSTKEPATPATSDIVEPATAMANPTTATTIPSTVLDSTQNTAETTIPTPSIAPTVSTPVQPVVPVQPITTVRPVTPVQPVTSMQPVVPVQPAVFTQSSTPVQPIIPQPDVSSPQTIPTPTPEPNLTMLSEVISAIARLEPQKYTADSYQALLTTLTNAKGIIGRDGVQQSEIDQIASHLLTRLTDLEPAPAVRQLSAFSSDAIDEMSPAAHWSAGVSAIDETTPFDYSNYHPPRARSPKLRSPLGGFMKSLTAGARAGLATYRRSRRSTKAA